MKNLPTIAGDAGDMSSIPGFGRSPGVGNDTPLCYSCLQNPMDRGAWRVRVLGVVESDIAGQITCLRRHTHWQSSHTLILCDKRPLLSLQLH